MTETQIDLKSEVYLENALVIYNEMKKYSGIHKTAEEIRNPMYEYEHPKQFVPDNYKLCWISFSYLAEITEHTLNHGRDNLEEAKKKGWRNVSARLNPHLMTEAKKKQSYGDYICYNESILCYKEIPLEIEDRIEHQSAGECEDCLNGEMRFVKYYFVPPGMIFDRLMQFKCSCCNAELVTTDNLKTQDFLKNGNI